MVNVIIYMKSGNDIYISGVGVVDASEFRNYWIESTSKAAWGNSVPQEHLVLSTGEDAVTILTSQIEAIRVHTGD